MEWGAKGEKRKNSRHKKWLIINIKAAVLRKKYGYPTNLREEAEGGNHIHIAFTAALFKKYRKVPEDRLRAFL